MRHSVQIVVARWGESVPIAALTRWGVHTVSGGPSFAGGC